MFSNIHLTEVSQPINEESGVLKHFKITGIFLHYIPNLNIALLINLNCKEIIAVLDVTLLKLRFRNIIPLLRPIICKI